MHSRLKISLLVFIWMVVTVAMGTTTSAWGNSVVAAGDTNVPIGQRAYPQLQWKYGWQDGMKANTIGSAKNGDAVPMADAYVSTGYEPKDMAAAYGFDQIPTKGEGATIAVVVAYGSATLQSDFDAFCIKYNLPQQNLTLYSPLGVPSSGDPNWAIETSMDVQWVHAMAPNAQIVVSISTNDQTVNLFQTVYRTCLLQNPNIISMSWGTDEFLNETNYNPMFAQYTNTAFVAASGDSGGGAPEWPSVMSQVIAVGGTTLLYDTTNKIVTSETAWAGSGGGLSTKLPRPAYQDGFNTNSARSTPDLSYNADPYTGFSVICNDPVLNNYGGGGWFVVGGTSAGTPQIAALLARRISQKLSNTNFLASIYKNTGTNWYGFNDITIGNNGGAGYTNAPPVDTNDPSTNDPSTNATSTNDPSTNGASTNTATGYPATIGYDLCTGLGSPNVVELANPLPTPTPKPTPVPISNQSISFPALKSRVYNGSYFTLVAKASSGLPVTFRSSNTNVVAISPFQNNVAGIWGAGSTVITASQTGSYPYKPAPNLLRPLVITKGSQSIQFAALPTHTNGAPPFQISATATLNDTGPTSTHYTGPVTFTSSATNVATVSSNTVTIVGIGRTTITATSAATQNYNKASLSRVLVVTKPPVTKTVKTQ